MPLRDRPSYNITTMQASITTTQASTHLWAHQIFQDTVRLYRQLHQIPEIGLQEYQTAAFLRSHLEDIQGVVLLPPLPELPTALIATVTPDNFKESILLRCELDALPFQQQSLLEFASSSGLHHACGHDGHMAVMLSTVRIVARERSCLNKKVTFCFQPGEEGKRGAQQLFKWCPSLTETVNHCYALHFNNAALPGCLKLDPGPVTALSSRFTISIQGRAAHCLAPHAGIDANFLGCSLVGQLYAMAGMTVPPLEGCSLVVIKVEGGSGVAMVSDCFTITGSLRTFSVQSYDNLKERISQLATNYCHSFQAEATLQFDEVNYRPVVNDSALVADLRNKIEAKGEFRLVEQQRCFAGEDFCQFSERRPCCYVSVGSGLADSLSVATGESLYPAHSPRHKLDESALLWAVKLWLTIVFD